MRGRQVGPKRENEVGLAAGPSERKKEREEEGEREWVRVTSKGRVRAAWEVKEK